MPKEPLLTGRLFLRVDPETKDRLDALRALAHDTTYSQTLRRLVHEAFEHHECRGQGCPVCKVRVDALAAAGVQ